MNPSRQMPERRTPRAAWKPYAMMFGGRRLVGAGLAALLTLLRAAPAAPQDYCSHEDPRGSCCPAKGFAGYPANTAEETGPNLYRLDRPEPSKYATNAVLEYCSTPPGCNPAKLTLDQKVAAVAWFVSKHMTWRGDLQNRKPFADNGYGSYNPGPGSDFPQPADLTLRISGTVLGGVPNDDFLGDCEDHAILRAALLRARPYCLPPSAIWDALDNPVTHEYNIVLYNKAYRVMDYGTIDRWLPKHTSSSHRSWYGWNEESPPRGWAPTPNHDYLVNKTNNCPSPKTSCAPWDYLNYYQDKCPCP